MTIYFSWVNHDEIFDEGLHARSDLDIFSLKISQKEGEVALATVVVTQGIDLPNLRRVFIAYQNAQGTHLLFVGQLVGFPLKIENNWLQLEFSAESEDADMQLKQLQQSLKKLPYFDELFVEDIHQDSPSEVLEARSALYAWSRLTGKVTVSDLFVGTQTLDLSDYFFEDSLKISLAETPLSGIDVWLSAEWIQQAQGEINVASKISSHFPRGIINALTGADLKRRWPEEGQKLGRSGYRVLESMLETINPPRTGVLQYYPTVSPPLWVFDQEKNVPRQQRLAWSWFKARLVLSWIYRQRRVENVRFHLKHKSQLSGFIRSKTRNLRLHLQAIDQGRSPPIGNLGSASFFITDRGRQAVEHALEVARAHLAASARCIEIEITTFFDALLEISCDHSVLIRDKRLPGGQAQGKVVEYALIVDGDKGTSLGWVRIAVAAGVEQEISYADEETGYCERIYAESSYLGETLYQTPSGIPYLSYGHQMPGEGVIYPQNLTVHDLVQAVYVRHAADQQIAYLQTQQYPVRNHLDAALMEVPTTIALDLLDLRTHRQSSHSITLELPMAWSAPKQINLKEGMQNEI